MSYPTIAQIQLSSRITNAVDDTVTLPTSTAIAAGDLIIIFHFTDGGALSATVPSPWVEIKDAAMAGSPNGRVFVAYLIASGGETSVTVTKEVTERFSAIAIKILAANWHGTTPPEISTGATGTSTTPDPDSLTVSWGSADNLWVAIMGMDDLNGTNTVDVYPYAGNNQKSTGVATAGVGAICSTESAVATLDPGTFTINPSDEWWAGTLAVRPAVTTISGIVLQTQASDTTSVTGTLAIKGVATQTQASDTLSSSATLSLSGVLAQSQAGDSLAATGTLALSGVLSQTQAGDTLSSSATLALAGVVSQSQAGDTLSSTAALDIAAIVNQTQAEDTLSSASTLAIVGTLSQTQAGDTLSATGAGAVSVSGELLQTQDSNTIIATGALYIAANTAATQDDNTASITSTLQIQGVFAQTQANNTTTFTSALYIQGAINVTQEFDSITGVGSKATVEINAQPDLTFLKQVRKEQKNDYEYFMDRIE